MGQHLAGDRKSGPRRRCGRSGVAVGLRVRRITAVYAGQPRTTHPLQQQRRQREIPPQLKRARRGGPAHKHGRSLSLCSVSAATDQRLARYPRQVSGGKSRALEQLPEPKPWALRAGLQTSGGRLRVRLACPPLPPPPTGPSPPPFPARRVSRSR